MNNNSTFFLHMIMPKLGDLEVYTLTDSPTPPTLISTFYWRNSVGSNGPFTDLYTCMGHYKAYLMGTPVNNALPPQGNVIHVDFKSRRRV